MTAQSIKVRARELGFDKVGVALAGASRRSDAFRAWIEREFHGSMGYMSRDVEKRLDTRRILDGARSVIVVAKNYYVPRARECAPDEGVISRYAWGDDYHDVMTERLHDLRRFVESLGGRAKVAVDTAPLLEKLWAVEAGLGWQGKHSNFMTTDHSSWLFLGEVVTDLDLPADAPFADDHCGTCTSCIDLCPTRAIVAPYVVDARKCIAYLTIEHRGVIPRELRAPMGNLIFGCDICQDVCPWNSHAKVAPEAAFLPRDGFDTPKLSAWATMTDEEFRRTFRGSPIKRAKRSGFVRNVVIALGNSGDPAAVDPLTRALEDADPLVRLHAAWSLGRLGARDVLEGRLSVETDPDVLAEIKEALGSARPASPGCGSAGPPACSAAASDQSPSGPRSSRTDSRS